MADLERNKQNVVAFYDLMFRTRRPIQTECSRQTICDGQAAGAP
jgi:hypothetical protein